MDTERKIRSGYGGDAAKSGLESIGKEMKENPPKQLAQTAKKFGVQRAEKQRVAILLSKGRKRGLVK